MRCAVANVSIRFFTVAMLASMAACGGGGGATGMTPGSSSSQMSSSASSMSSSLNSSSSSSVASSSTASSSAASSSSIAATHSISGLVGGPAQNEGTISLSGPKTASTTSPNGPYIFSNLADGTYTITPNSRINTYIPASLVVTVSGADVKDQNFDSVFGSYWNHSNTSADVHYGPYSIWFADATHGWAVSNSVIQSWNGTTWTMVDPGSIVNSQTMLQSVSGSSVNDVWAVGFAGVILHWNGSTWSAMTSPVGTEDLFTVWSRTANDAWIGGRTSILHWNGTSWSVTPNNRDGGIGAAVAFWGSSGADAWTVTGTSILAHWDGSVWNFISFTSQPLRGLWGFGANDIWAAGLSGSIQHWDGSTWAPVTSPTTTSLFSVWGSSSGDVWAVGNGGVLIHWNGVAWSSRDSGTDNNLLSVFGAGANNVWIAGPNVLLRAQ